MQHKGRRRDARTTRTSRPEARTTSSQAGRLHHRAFALEAPYSGSAVFFSVCGAAATTPSNNAEPTISLECGMFNSLTMSPDSVYFIA